MNERPLRIFSKSFLDEVAGLDCMSHAAFEAGLSGPWEVVPRGTGYEVTRTQDQPEATATQFDIGQLLAATLEAAGTASHLSLGIGRTLEGFPVNQPTAVGLQAIGWFRYSRDELMEILNAYEVLLRNPRVLAHLLLAAPHSTLERAQALASEAWEERIEAEAPGKPRPKDKVPASLKIATSES